MRASVHPDIVAVRTPPFPDPQTYRGIEGVIRMSSDWTAGFLNFEMSTRRSPFEAAGCRSRRG